MFPTENLHHAYIIEGDREAIRFELLEFIEKQLKFRIQANPDFYHERFESFSIDDARNLREMQSTKALSGSRKIFIIETLNMTVEAQNSLLKIFEEPSPGIHFFILAPLAEVFLPTLRSRVVIISKHDDLSTNKNIKNVQAQEFLDMSIKNRLAYVAELAEEKNKNTAIQLIDSLIRIIHINFANKDSNKQQDQTFILEELLKTRSYLSDRSSSLKLLLENIAIII